MRLTRILCLLLALFIAFGAQAAEKPKQKPPKKHTSIVKTYSSSSFAYPVLCEEEKYSHICDMIMELHARSFEREVIVALNESIDPDHLEFDIDIGNSEQEGELMAFRREYINMITFVVILKQNILGTYENFILETANVDIETGKYIDFQAMFDDYELAAMLCARAIEERFPTKNNIPAQVIVAATEYRPRNFIVTKKGIRFYFTKDIDPKADKPTVTLEVPLERLMRAGPKSVYWPHLVEEKPEGPEPKQPGPPAHVLKEAMKAAHGLEGPPPEGETGQPPGPPPEGDTGQPPGPPPAGVEPHHE